MCSSDLIRFHIIFSANWYPGRTARAHPDSVQVGLNWIPLTEIRSANLYPKALKARFSADGWIEGEVYAGDVN